MTTNNTTQQTSPTPPRAASIGKRWSVFYKRLLARFATQQPQPQAGPIAQKLAALHANSHQTVSAQVGQQVPVPHQQKRRPLALVLMMAPLILVSGVLWLAKLPWYIIAIPSGIGLIIVGYAVKWTGFGEYTRTIDPKHTEFQRSKTLWDWLQLLLIPVLLTAGGYWFQAQQHTYDQTIATANRAKDRQIASDQQQEATLNAYLDDMTTLLLDKKLGSQAAADKAASAEAAVVARERTLTTLGRLRDGRNRIVLQFLQNAHLIGIQDAVIDLSNADLSNDDLSGADLSNVDLSNDNLSNADLRCLDQGGNKVCADLSHANLSGANLSGADLSNADLSNADLSNANLSCLDQGGNKVCTDLNGTHLNGTHLSYVTLQGANLSDADLGGALLNSADLSNANLSDADLNSAFLSDADLTGAILQGALLSGAFLGDVTLQGANLSSANLSGANLSNAILNDANLSDAGNLYQPQLKTVYSCTNAMLSTGLKCPYSRSVVTLTYWYTEGTAETPVILQLIQKFQHLNPGIKIKAVPKSFFQTQAAFITAAQKDNAPPDVLRSDVSWVPQFASQGYLRNIDCTSQNIDSCISQSDLADYMSASYDLLSYDRYNGHLYGLPQVTDYLALLYNKTELANADLAKAGITSPPKTMDDFERAARRIVQRKEATYGFETTGTSYYVLPFLWAFGGGMIDEHNNKNILVSNDGSVAGLNFLLNLQNIAKVMPPKVDFGNGITNMVNDFMSGKTAMIFDGPWDVSKILKNGSAFTNASNLGIAAIPIDPSGNQHRSPVGGQSYVIYAHTPHPDQAYQFISFMSSKDSQVAIAEANHTLPTRQSAYQALYQDQSVSGDTITITIISAFHSPAILNTAHLRPPIKQGAYLFNAFDANIQAALDGTESASDALTAVHDAWQQLLAGP